MCLSCCESAEVQGSQWWCSKVSVLSQDGTTGSPFVSGENKLEVIMSVLSPGKYKIVCFTVENLANKTIIYINKLN